MWESRVITLYRRGKPEDTLLWKPNLHGIFSVSSAYDVIRKRGNKISWHSEVWHQAVHPKVAGIAWKLQHKCVATDDTMQRRGVAIVSRCIVCNSNPETLYHLLWECKFATEIWKWNADRFRLRYDFTSYRGAIQAAKMRSPWIRELWLVCVLGTMVSLWKHRNLMVFKANEKSESWCKCNVIKQMSWSFELITGCSGQEDGSVLSALGFDPRPRRVSFLKFCSWFPPTQGQVKANTDGAALGNPGNAGIGISFRDSDGHFLDVIFEGVGIADNFWSESLAVVTAMEVATERGWNNLWVESDSLSTVSAFNSGKIPWELRTRWLRCKSLIETLTITHIWREANLVADQASKMGAIFQTGYQYRCGKKPDWIQIWEVPYGLYTRVS